MKPAFLASALQLSSLILVATLFSKANPALSQIIPDDMGTESSVVNPRDANSESIDGGAVRGQNLFHSFTEFNVGEDRGVYFANPDAVTNIFSRVTGNDVSNILGTLGVDGAANLYLINPNGIVFGEGASLDVQGSFTATTADGIEFGARGSFSAINAESPNLLTINPSAYLFNQVAPGAIANNSQASADFNPSPSFDDSYFGLRVPDGQNLLLLGGNVEADGGGLTASGGRIDISAIAGEGVIGLNNNGSLNISDNISRGDVSLTNGAKFSVTGDGGGDIAIAAKNIRIDSASTITTGIYSSLSSPDAQAGDIFIDATDNITVDNSRVANEVNLEAVGNAGDIFLNAGSLQVLNGSQIESLTFGRGDGGNVTVRASNIELSGTSSGLFTTIGSQAQGNGGKLTVNTDNLSLGDGAQVSASTFGQGDSGNLSIIADNSITLDASSYILNNVQSRDAVGDAGKIEINTGSLSATNGSQINSFTRGQGDAGDITIQATNAVAFDGVDSNGNYTGLSSSVEAGGVGNGGNINLEAGSLSLTNGALLEASVYEASDSLPSGRGKGGNIDIQTGSLSATNGSQINSFTRGQGNAGDIVIQATNAVAFDGVDSNGYYSGLFSSVEAGGVGNGGNINLEAGSLSLTNGALLEASVYEASDSLPSGRGKGGNINIQTGNLVARNDGLISSSTSGQGDSGNIAITANNSIFLDALDIVNSVESIDAVGDAGKIDITTGSLSATNGSQINSFTRGQGNAGDISINATDSVTFDGVDSNGNSSGLYSSVEAGGVGVGGNINLEAGSLSLTNGGQLDVGVYEASDSLPSGRGNGGNINIQTGNLVARNGGQISSSTSGQGDSGNLSIIADNSITLDTSSYVVNNVQSRDAVGDAGKIDITTGSLSATNGSQINSFTRGQGNAGDISINATDSVTFDGVDSNGNSSGLYSSVEAGGVGNGGNINLEAGSLSLTNGGRLNASVRKASDSLPSGRGNGGNINIQTGSLSATNGSQINSFTRGQGDAGDISINATDAVTFDGVDSNGNSSGLYSSVEAGGVGVGGNIKLEAGSLSLTNGGLLNASVRGASDSLPSGRGKGGNINIQTGNLVARNDGLISSSTSGQGDSGNIAITANNSIFLDALDIVNSVESIDAVGDAGKIDITTGSLSATNGSQINSFTRGQGNAGDISINATDSVTFDGVNSNGNPSGLSSSVEAGGVGNGGNINLEAGSLSLTNGGRLNASVREAFDSLPSGRGQGGSININVDNTLTIVDGSEINVATSGQGNAGEVNINADFLNLDNNTFISSVSTTNFNAGNINLNVTDSLQATDSFISTSSTQSSGGNLNIFSGDIQLRGNSDLTTNIFVGKGSGGNIAIEADSVIAFDDSDIFASAPEGQGGNVTLDTPAYFGENFTLNSLTANPDTLDNNSRADVNATGAVSSGTVSIPNVSFIQNSLNDLPNNSINTDELVANSCVVPVGDRSQGKFIITGTESLPVRPGDNLPSKYPTGEVRNVPEKPSGWQLGDPIIEPQGAYRLANGKLVLSRQCSR